MYLVIICLPTILMFMPDSVIKLIFQAVFLLQNTKSYVYTETLFCISPQAGDVFQHLFFCFVHKYYNAQKKTDNRPSFRYHQNKKSYCAFATTFPFMVSDTSLFLALEFTVTDF